MYIIIIKVLAVFQVQDDGQGCKLRFKKEKEKRKEKKRRVQNTGIVMIQGRDGVSGAG